MGNRIENIKLIASIFQITFNFIGPMDDRGFNNFS